MIELKDAEQAGYIYINPDRIITARRVVSEYSAYTVIKCDGISFKVIEEPVEIAMLMIAWRRK